MAEPTDKHNKKIPKKKQPNEKQKTKGVEDNKSKVTPPRDPKTLLIENRMSQYPLYKLSLGQVGVGCFAILVQLLLIFFNDVHLNLSTFGEGFFCGIVIVTVGFLGLFASHRVNLFTVRSFFIASIAALLFAFLLLALSVCLLVDVVWYQKRDNYAQSGFYILKTLLSLQIILAVTEMILSITCSLMCFKSSQFSTSTNLAMQRFPVGSIKVFSYLHIAVGSSLIVLFIALFIFHLDTRHSLTNEEVYCGLVIISIGSFGLYSIKKGISLTNMTAFLILNFFGCVFAGIIISLSSVRIIMLQQVHENYKIMRQEDLMMIPSLNCTKDVIESFQIKKTPKVFGIQTSTPSPAEIKFHIEQCEIMKMETINEANELLSSSTVPGMSGPNTVYYLEICIGIFELLISVICIVKACKASCSKPQRVPIKAMDEVDNEGRQIMPEEGGRDLTEEEKWDLVVQEYQEYRK